MNAGDHAIIAGVLRSLDAGLRSGESTKRSGEDGYPMAYGILSETVNHAYRVLADLAQRPVTDEMRPSRTAVEIDTFADSDD